MFKKHRRTERERKWTLYAVNLFWAAMIIRQPPAIEQGLAETRKGRSRDRLWPRVQASAQAFYQKAAGLRADLFLAVYEAFAEHPAASSADLCVLDERSVQTVPRGPACGWLSAGRHRASTQADMDVHAARLPGAESRAGATRELTASRRV